MRYIKCDKCEKESKRPQNDWLGLVILKNGPEFYEGLQWEFCSPQCMHDWTHAHWPVYVKDAVADTSQE